MNRITYEVRCNDRKKISKPNPEMLPNVREADLKGANDLLVSAILWATAYVCSGQSISYTIRQKGFT